MHMFWVVYRLCNSVFEKFACCALMLYLMVGVKCGKKYFEATCEHELIQYFD